MHCVVSGRVQGVWFRASAKEYAHRLGLTGWVRNRPDGHVELVACGPAPAREALREWLKRGPELAQVRKLSCRTIELEEKFADFTIR